jgi:novobiocin biosynthesis protein NovU/D-mycarose 3-C-methyltransferase
MYKRLTACRACNGTDLVEVFQFAKPMPLANDWVLPGGEHQGFVPLRVLFCKTCTLAQLGETVDPGILYQNYLYVTSNSQTMQRHFDRLVKDMVSENGFGSLLEVGSNDGRFLEFASSRGFTPAIGIDPAANLALNSVPQGVRQIVGFFDDKTAADVRFHFAENKGFDTILARHCFCHQEWKQFMDAVMECHHKQTLVCIEVPYAPDLLRRVELDSIYQEHTSYLTIKSVVALLKNYPFHLHGALKYGVHGGVILLMLRHNDSGITPHLSADEMLAEEHVTVDTWKDFGIRARMKIENLQKLVEDLRSKGKIVSAFGASAKGSVLINACGFTKDDVAFVTDNSPLKPGRLVPGTDIPVIPEDEMLSQHPDVAICAAWNYRTEILEKMAKYRQRGGKFIFPTESGWEIV